MCVEDCWAGGWGDATSLHPEHLHHEKVEPISLLLESDLSFFSKHDGAKVTRALPTLAT